MRRILIIEPYYGGSHKHFLEGLQRFVAAEYTMLTLPARKWKMRMQLSAPWFVSQILAMSPEKRKFHKVLCSTFVDVSVLRALLCRLEGWNENAEYLTYFHENQFAYPRRAGDNSFHQFTAINFNTALASDKIAFNSQFNFDSFFSGCGKLLKCAADMKLMATVEVLKGKSRILSPGIDFTGIDKIPVRSHNPVPVIVWNHRWEHDKNPDEFFSALTTLKDEGLDFRLIILGQSFQSVPDCFKKGQLEFKDKIIHWGFVSSYLDYIALLRRGDIVVSTSLHEFYGISVIEAVRAGCRPLLPGRLSYPELFGNKFLYGEEGLAGSLKEAVLTHSRPNQKENKRLTDKFSWQALCLSYERWLLD
ncbi:MAG: DUF3524 domain-containing protein [Deltaproteobacteria bacterium]|nr:DUF3524 domain-containing protein [Deltaproteobacteria bacterium]